MKVFKKYFVLFVLCALLLLGCTKTFQDYPSLIINASNNLPKEEYNVPQSISMTIDHTFPFAINANINAVDTEEIQISEITKQKLTQDTLQRLLDFFSNGNDWTDEEGFDISLAENNNSFYAFQKSGNEVSSFCFTQDNMFSYKRNNSVVIMRDEYLYDSPERANDFLEEPDISYEKALETAERVLADLDFCIDDNIALCYGSKAVGYIGDDPIIHGWEFVFTRKCGSLQSPYHGEYDLWTNSEPPVACAPWEKECIFICIDKEGLFRIDSRGLGVQKRVIDTDVVLLPFDNILQNIIHQIQLQHPHQEKGTSNWSIEIKRILLCSTLVNNIAGSVGYMIPTWEVEYELRYSVGGVNELFTQFTYFNAVDGTYIEPRITVNDAMEAYRTK